MEIGLGVLGEDRTTGRECLAKTQRGVGERGTEPPKGKKRWNREKCRGERASKIGRNVAKSLSTAVLSSSV